MAAGDILHSFASPAGSPRGLAWSGRSLWHADYGTDRIYELDPVTGAIRNSFASPAGSPRGLAWSGRSLWNVDYDTDTIYQLEP